MRTFVLGGSSQPESQTVVASMPQGCPVNACKDALPTHAYTTDDDARARGRIHPFVHPSIACSLVTGEPS